MTGVFPLCISIIRLDFSYIQDASSLYFIRIWSGAEANNHSLKLITPVKPGRCFSIFKMNIDNQGRKADMVKD